MNQCPKCQTTWICLESGIKTWKQHRPKTGFTACAIRLAKASLTSILDIRPTASCRVPSMPCWEIPGGTNCNPPSLWSLMSLNWGEVCKSFFIHVCPLSSIATTTRCGRCVWFPRSNPVGSEASLARGDWIQHSSTLLNMTCFSLSFSLFIMW